MLKNVHIFSLYFNNLELVFQSKNIIGLKKISDEIEWELNYYILPSFYLSSQIVFTANPIYLLNTVNDQNITFMLPLCSLVIYYCTFKLFFINKRKPIWHCNLHKSPNQFSYVSRYIRMWKLLTEARSKKH